MFCFIPQMKQTERILSFFPAASSEQVDDCVAYYAGCYGNGHTNSSQHLTCGWRQAIVISDCIKGGIVVDLKPLRK